MNALRSTKVSVSMVSHPPVWRLKIQLLGITPTVWRRLDTYADVELAQLHYFIGNPPTFSGRQKWS
nr:hypothetical protein [Xanthomonas phaseoli]